MITEISDPTLWESLHDVFVKQPGVMHVAKATKLYKAHVLHDGELVFELIETLDYLDSRSLTSSRPATYTKLGKGNVD